MFCEFLFCIRVGFASSLSPQGKSTTYSTLCNMDALLLAASLGNQPSLLFLFFLQGILFTLTFATSKAFCCQPLVTKRCPGTKVLTSFAPFDFQPCRYNNPYVDITKSAKSFVLCGNDGIASLVAHHVLAIAVSGRKAAVVGLGALSAALLVLVSRRARTGLSTHDTTAHTIGKVHCLLLRHVSWEVNQTRELGHLSCLDLFNITEDRKEKN